MPINPTSASYAIDMTITAVAYEEINNNPLMLPVLASMMPGTGSQDVVGSLATFDTFEESDDGVEPDDDNPGNLFTKTFVHRERKKAFSVTRNVITDNRFGLLAQYGEQLGAAYTQTLEQNLAALFHDAFAGATHTAEDGSAICASHTYGVTTQNNGSATAALDYSAWKSAVNAAATWQDSRGNPLRIRLDTLLVPTAKEEDGWQILGQHVGDPTSAERRGNFYSSGGTMKMISWDLLGTALTGGSDTVWFGLNLPYFKRNLKWFMRAPLEVYGETKMFGTRRVGGYARYSYGVCNPFGIYGSNATA